MKSLFILFVSVLLIIGISKAQNTVYGPIQIYGTYEGAAILKPSTTWKSVTQGQYNRVEEFFKEQVPSGMTREYYLAVRFADNIPGCSNLQLRFWYTWINKPGHIVNIPPNYGNVSDGSLNYVRIPTTNQQNVAGGMSGNGYQYWKLDARINGCLTGYDYVQARITGIYLMAIDKPTSTNIAVELNVDPNAVGSLYSFGIANNVLIQDGKVGIGLMGSGSLDVNGEITSKKVRVTQAGAGWPDYVFHDDYHLSPLSELAAYIKANKHLPDVPSAQEVERSGVDVGEMNKILLQKIEELTLHLLEQQKRIEQLEAKQQE